MFTCRNNISYNVYNTLGHDLLMSFSPAYLFIEYQNKDDDVKKAIDTSTKSE